MLAFRLAQLNVVATLFLLFVGATVHPTGSSLDCPEWWFFPTCHGEVFPEMKGGVLFEHGHRLTAWTVGLLTVALAVLLFRRRKQDPAGWRLGLGAAVLVAVQGTLGGVTVHLKLPPVVSILHLAVAMIFFCLLLYLARRLAPPRPAGGPVAPGLRRLAAAATLAVFVQIVLGAVVRHMGAALQCVDLPLCGGKLWPDGLLPQIHMIHRLGAVAAGLVVLAAAGAVIWRVPGRPRLLAVTAIGVLVAQVTLGIYSVLTFLSVAVVVAHLVVGAILLGLMLSLYLGLRERAARARPASAEAWGAEEAAART